MQAYSNYRNSSTGQLSAVMILMLFLGAAARIFTSYQETGDVLIMAQFAGSFLCNTILMLQIVWYWNNDETTSITGPLRQSKKTKKIQ